jgi:Sulfatase
VLREQTLARQKQLGIVPANTDLTARSPGIPAWDSLSADDKKLYARMMEIYAGYLEQTDYNVGRVLKAIDDMGIGENTLVIYIVGDNGASAEGGPGGSTNLEGAMNGVVPTTAQMLPMMDELGTWKTYNHFPVGWAHALDTPFQWTKQIASHFGGTRNGMVISWPAHIKEQGEIRSQWHHVIDILPTVLDVSHVRQPVEVNGVKQRPIEGVSMAYTLFVQDGYLVYENNFFGRERDQIKSSAKLANGPVTAEFRYTHEDKTYAGGGTGVLYVNGQEVGRKRFAHVVPARYSATETFDIGRDTGEAVSEAYTAPFVFTGRLDHVTVDIAPQKLNPEAAAKTSDAERATAMEIQ